MSLAGDSVVCTSCGTSIRSSARFCENCGAPQDTRAPGDPAEAATVIQAREATTAMAPVDLVKPPPDHATRRLWAGDPAASAVAEPSPSQTPPSPAPQTATAASDEAFCGQCGRAYPPGTQFCVGCGARRGAASPAMPPPGAVPPPGDTPPGQAAGAPYPALDAARERAAEWQKSLPAPFNAVAFELLVACSLMTIAGLLTLYPAIKMLPDISQLLDESGVARQIGLLALTVWAMLALAGIALIFLAWRMAHGDRVASGLSYVLLGGLGGAIAIGSEHSTALVLAMLTCFGAVAVLALAPQVQELFAAAAAPDGEQPTAIALARTLVAVWAAVLVFIGVMFLPLTDLDGQFVPIGVLLIPLGAAAWYLNGRLAKGDPTARSLMSAGAGVYLVLLLVLGERQPGLLLPLGLAAGIVFNLWVPREAQQHFSRA